MDNAQNRRRRCVLIPTDLGLAPGELDELRAAMSIDGAAPVRAKIKKIVPEYSFQENPAAGKVSAVPAQGWMKKAAGHD